MSYRQGLLDELDRTLGPSVDADGNVTNLRLEMEKGARIRDAVVDYRNIPWIVSVMEALGAPFAPFFGGAVRAVGRAAVRHPERVAAVQRGEKDVQDQFGWTFPNPVNTAERLFFDPGRTLAERSGVIPAALGWTRPPVESGVHFDTGAQLAAEIARTAGGPWILTGRAVPESAVRLARGRALHADSGLDAATRRGVSVPPAEPVHADAYREGEKPGDAVAALAGVPERPMWYPVPDGHGYTD